MDENILSLTPGLLDETVPSRDEFDEAFKRAEELCGFVSGKLPEQVVSGRDGYHS